MAEDDPSPKPAQPAEDTPSPLRPQDQRVSLKSLAAHLGLSPATVSVVLNNVPGRSIPESTRERIRKAAIELNYHPSHVAQSLRRRQSFAVGILLPEISDGYHTLVMAGIADHLVHAGYVYLIAHHNHVPKLVDEYIDLLISRGVEGLIAIDTNILRRPAVPVVAVAGHTHIPGLTNVILDHQRAARQTMQHLHDLGHTHVAFIRGQPTSSDSAIRWRSTIAAAKQHHIAIHKELTVELDREITSPEVAYPLVHKLLQQRKPFTAIVCFNDVAAIGALRALRDARLRVPEDVSVIGFDDIPMAAFTNPSLTTIRQPLHLMGATAAAILLDRLAGRNEHPAEVAVQPELIPRESTSSQNP